jgi:glutathione S-transferase
LATALSLTSSPLVTANAVRSVAVPLKWLPLICRFDVPLAFKALACDAILIQDPADQSHFRKTVERFTGQSPEALKAVQGEAFARLAGALDPSRATLKRQAFLGGATPSYADYALFSVFQWARIVSPVRALPENDPMLRWIDTLLDLNQGYARDTTAFY